MSLLIKALQKAEAGKAASMAEKIDDLEFDLEPITPQAGKNVPFKDESGFGASPSVKPTNSKTSPEAAASIFHAKVARTKSRTGLFAGLGFFLLLMLAGGFYWYLDSLEHPPITVARIDPPKPIVAPQNIPAAIQGSTTSAVATNDNEHTSVTNLGSTDSTELHNVASKPLAATEATESIKPASTEAAVRPIPSKETTTAQPANENLKISRNRATEPSINPKVAAAYQAYEANDDNSAKRLYLQALQSEPRNSDALLGLAAIAVRQDRDDEAIARYQKVLELDPQNTTAQSALASLAGRADPQSAEPRLKRLLAQQPDAAPLQAALGDLYAEQKNWPEAQAAYFEAYRLDASADNAFNLAVSLDQLNKPKLALEYYQRAMVIISKQGANNSQVKQAPLEKRIQQLQQTLSP